VKQYVQTNAHFRIYIEIHCNLHLTWVRTSNVIPHFACLLVFISAVVSLSKNACLTDLGPQGVVGNCLIDETSSIDNIMVTHLGNIPILMDVIMGTVTLCINKLIVF